jgi:F420-dependent oxidoreductase-like protein
VKHGINLSPGPVTLGQHLEHIAHHEAVGLDTVWSGQLFGPDLLTLYAMAGATTSRIALGTSVIPTPSRHPLVLASQALTTQAATGGRLLLGVGSSHKALVEGVLGADYDRPAAYLREYLTVLPALLRSERIVHTGERLHVDTTGAFGRAGVPQAEAPPVYVGTMFPRSLAVAGELADGIVTWLVGPRTLAEVVIPIATEAAAAAGRPRPRFVAGIPITVCAAGEAEDHLALVDRRLRGFTALPVYEQVLARERAAGPADLAAVGDEATVEARLQAFAEAGVDEVYGMCFGDEQALLRTAATLGGLS